MQNKENFYLFMFTKRQTRIIAYFILFNHLICSRFAVEGKVSVSIRESVNKCQCCWYLIIHKKTSGLDPCFLNRCLQKLSKLIIANLTGKCRLFIQLCPAIIKSISSSPAVTSYSLSTSVSSRYILGTSVNNLIIPAGQPSPTH